MILDGFVSRASADVRLAEGDAHGDEQLVDGDARVAVAVADAASAS
jgi:hypothetical protein